MTKKDYVLIAGAIKDSRHYQTNFGATEAQKLRVNLITSDVINRLSRALELDNPRFDRARFIEACGITLSPVLPHNTLLKENTRYEISSKGVRKID